MKFYIGLFNLSHAKDFNRSFISFNRLLGRQSIFKVNDWIMDSGAFSQVQNGGFVYSAERYVEIANRWTSVGNLQAIVSQDYMCEPAILKRTNRTILEHQIYTIRRYDIIQKYCRAYVMPVLQGYMPDDYVRHLKMYGKRLKEGQWVGIGSICKRNTDPFQIMNILEMIKMEREDLCIHAFGLKVTALAYRSVRDLLYSADSMAWSWGARRQGRGRDANSKYEALKFANRIDNLCDRDNRFLSWKRKK